MIAVQTADDGEAAIAELGPPRAVAQALLTAALPPVAVLAAVAAGGVLLGDLAPATLGVGPRAFTPAAVVVGLGLGGVSPLGCSGVVAPSARRLG